MFSSFFIHKIHNNYIIKKISTTVFVDSCLINKNVLNNSCPSYLFEILSNLTTLFEKIKCLAITRERLDRFGKFCLKLVLEDQRRFKR